MVELVGYVEVVLVVVELGFGLGMVGQVCIVFGVEVVGDVVFWYVLVVDVGEEGMGMVLVDFGVCVESFDGGVVDVGCFWLVEDMFVQCMYQVEQVVVVFVVVYGVFGEGVYFGIGVGQVGVVQEW